MQSNQLAKQEENSQKCGNNKKSSPQIKGASESIKSGHQGREKIDKNSGGANTPNSLNFEQFVNHLVFEKYTNEYKLDKKTRSKTDEIIQDHLKRHQELRNADPSQIHAMVRAAILIASKCQEYLTEGGKMVRGCGFTTSFLLRSKPQIQIEEFQQKFQELRLEANLEKVVNLECVNVENKLIIQLAFYSKFSKIWEGLKIEDRSLNVASSNSMKKLTWMIFIISKMKILAGQTDITETAILLFASIYWALILCPSDVTCALIEDFKEKLDQNPEEEKKEDTSEEKNDDNQSSVDKQLFGSRGGGGLGNRSLTIIKLDQAVRGQLSKTLSAKHSEQETDYMITCVRDMLLKMKQKGRLQGFTSIDDESSEEEHPNKKKQARSQEPCDVHYPLTYIGMQERLESEGSKCDAPSSKCLHGIFDQANLTRNVRLLDNYYQKQMTIDFEFDERYFINCNGLSHTPIKLISPLSYGNYAGGGGNQHHQKQSSPIKAENAMPLTMHNSLSSQQNNQTTSGLGPAAATANNQSSTNLLPSNSLSLAAGGPQNQQVRGLGGGLAALAAGKQHSWGQMGEVGLAGTKRTRTYTDEAVLTFVKQPSYRNQIGIKHHPSHQFGGNLASTAYLNAISQSSAVGGLGQIVGGPSAGRDHQAAFPLRGGINQNSSNFDFQSPQGDGGSLPQQQKQLTGSNFMNKIYQKRKKTVQSSEFGVGVGGGGGVTTMQRTLEFSTSLKEQNIRSQLGGLQSQSGAPNFGAFPGVTPHNRHQSQQQMSNAAPMQTPIGQMIQIRSWAVNLRDTINLSDQTGFIASLYMFVPASKANEEQYVAGLGSAARKYIMDHLDLLITRLAQNRVNPGANISTEKEKISVKSTESIYKITCYLVEKFLIFERERYLRKQRQQLQVKPAGGLQIDQISLNTENLVQILNHETFKKSCLVYAAMIHFHQIGESELTPAVFLDAINLPAFQLFRTFETFMKLQLQMPHQITELFRDLERQLILHLVWRKDSEVVKNIKLWLRLQNEPATFQEVQDREKKEKEIMMPLNDVFKRVYEVAANTLMELCTELQINERVSEIIWSVVKVTLSQETQILIGRHLDQLLMCAIYGVCKVHPDCIKPAAQNNDKMSQSERLKMASTTTNKAPQAIKFNDIIDAYKKINKIRLSKTGCWTVNVLKSSSVSWVYIEVPYYRQDEPDTVIDIIQFYNKVYLETMKGYIIETKRLEMDQGSKTPVIKNHSFKALLTPGGREQPGIPNFRKNTPLIDSILRPPRNELTIYINSGGVVQKKPPSQFATASNPNPNPNLANHPGQQYPPHSSNQQTMQQQSFGQNQQANNPHKTPRYNALYAPEEHSLASSSANQLQSQQNVLTAKSTLQERSQAYTEQPIHRLASLQNQTAPQPQIDEANANEEFEGQEVVPEQQKDAQNEADSEQAEIKKQQAPLLQLQKQQDGRFQQKFSNLAKGMVEEGRQLPAQPKLVKQPSMLDPEIRNQDGLKRAGNPSNSMMPRKVSESSQLKDQVDQNNEEADFIDEMPPMVNDAAFYAMGHQMSFMQSPGKSNQLRIQHSLVEQQQKNSEQLSEKLIDREKRSSPNEQQISDDTPDQQAQKAPNNANSYQ